MSSPKGWFIHYTSNKVVRPKSGDKPTHYEQVVVHSNGLGDSRFQFQFVPREGEGHYGYLKELGTGFFVHLRIGYDPPTSNDTQLMYYNRRHPNALFYYDEEADLIHHKYSDEYWHPKGGKPNPGDNTDCVIYRGYHDNNRFRFVDKDRKKIPFYPPPTLEGHWVILNANLDARADHEFSITYEVGQERTVTETVGRGFTLKGEAAKSDFEASAEFRKYVERTDSTTWSAVKTETFYKGINFGQSIVTWQYHFIWSRFGDTYTFHANIYGDTNDPNTPPELDSARSAP